MPNWVACGIVGRIAPAHIYTEGVRDTHRPPQGRGDRLKG